MRNFPQKNLSEIVGPMANTIETFISRLERQGECLVYDRNHDTGGYGRFSYKGKEWTAHRFSYSYFVGEIGDFHVLHACDNPPCVLPAHLWLGTNKDNMLDKQKKGRGRREPTSHCINGHERNETNMRIDKFGNRHCRPCQKISQQKHRNNS